MDSKPLHPKPTRRKVHVVYYLNRGGQLDHPHLIEGYLHSTQEGLRLKDVKRWLAVLRGRGLPNSYAWSYKRTYKSGYVWHDLSENDFIHPLCKNEYVLMGSEIRDFLLDKCSCANQTAVRKELDKFHKQSEDSNIDYSKEVLNKDSDASPGMGCDDRKSTFPLSCSPSAPCDEDVLISKRPSKILTKTKLTDCGLDAETTDDLSPGRPNKFVLNEINVYKARTLALSTDKGTDAATQTGESKRCSTDEISPLQLPALRLDESPRTHATAGQVYSTNIHETNIPFSPASAPSPVLQGTSESPASTRSLKSTSSNRVNRKDPNSSGKSKPHASSQVLKQLLSCGSVDIDESSIFNLQSFGLHPATVVAHHSQRLQGDLSKSWSCRPCRGSGVVDNKSVSGLSDGSKDAFGSSPDSAFLKKVMVSSFTLGSTSPGYLSICSSSPRRSSAMEAREGGNEDGKGMKEAFAEAMEGATASPRRSVQLDYLVARQALRSPRGAQQQAESPRVSVASTVEIMQGTKDERVAARSPANWRELLWSPRKDAKNGPRKEKKRTM